MGIQKSLKLFLESIYFERFIEAVIIIYIIVYSCSTFESGYNDILQFIETVIIAIFAIEFLLKAYVFRLKYVCSIWGVIDLISIIPLISYFKLVRILKALKTFQSLERLSIALRALKSELMALIISSIVILFFAAALLFEFEHEAQPEKFKSILDAFWWSIVTMTTVGYGDLYPVTFGGRVIASGLIFFSIVTVAIPTGLIASEFNKTPKEPRRNRT